MAKIELWFWRHQPASHSIVVHNNTGSTIGAIKLILENQHQQKHNITIDNLNPSEARAIHLLDYGGLESDFLPVSKVTVETIDGFTYVYNVQGVKFEIILLTQ
jgi:hypothetical protein